MDIPELLGDAFDRIRERVPALVDGLTDDQLAARPGGSANPVGWLVWHLSRVQDDHLAGAAGTGQVWHDDGWEQRFGLDLPADDTGYGHDDDAVGRVRVGAGPLAGYHAAVADRTASYVAGLTAADLDRVVDERFDPPVTLGVRLVSVVDDCLEHVGQAAYARGIIAP